MIDSPNESMENSMDTSQEDEFLNPGTSKLDNKSVHSIKSNNKSEYNRNLLKDYAKDQGLIGKLGGTSDNLDGVNHNDDLGMTKNSILINYLGRGKGKWGVEKSGELNQFSSTTQETRLTKGIWGNEFGDYKSQTTNQYTSTTLNNPANSTPVPVPKRGDTVNRTSATRFCLIKRKRELVDDQTVHEK